MSELVTLPMQMTSRKAAVFVVPLALSCSIIAAGSLYYVFTMPGTNMHVSPPLQIGIPIGLIVLQAITMVFLTISMKPRRVEIRTDGIATTPLPVMGFSIGAPEQRAISEFQSLDLEKQKGSKGAVIYMLKLRGVAGAKDLVLDIPEKADRHQFAAQLGAALKLKVNANA